MTRFRKLSAGSVTSNSVEIEETLTALEHTFTRSGTEVPRLCLWDPALALSCIYEAQRKPLKAIEWGLKGLEALGYVIEGGSMPRASDAPLVVKRWGLMENELVGGWIALSRAYRLVAPDLEPAARAYAKICYKICVGEDETFEETYARALA